MKKYTIQVSDEEEKALLTELEDIQLHMETIVHNLARMAMGRIILKCTDKNPQKLSHKAREALIKPMKLETIVERIAREKVELEG